MAKAYKIRAGFSFAMGDGTVKTGGDSIELDADTAANHAHKLEEVVAEAQKAAASGNKTGKKAASGTEKSGDEASAGASDPAQGEQTPGADSVNSDTPGAQQ